MQTVTASEAQAKLYKFINEAASSHQPIVIAGKRSRAVLLGGGVGRDSGNAVPAVRSGHAGVDQAGPGRTACVIGDRTEVVMWKLAYRLVYEVFEKERVVRVLRMWSPYE